jgi:hypothetical protein
VRGGVAVAQRGAGRWGGGTGSIPLPERWVGACLLPRPEDGCLLAFTFRSVAAGGRAVCRLVRRAVASPSFGSYEAGDPLQVWAGRVLPMWTRATRRQALGFQAAGGMASGLVAGGRSDEGRMGRRQSITGRPLCWRRDEAAAVCQVAIRVPGIRLEAAGNDPLSRRLHAGGRCAALGSDVRQEGVQRAGGGAAAGKQALVLVGRLS